MKKKISIMILLGLLVLSGCKGQSTVTNINLPTAATTGTLYPLGSSLANMWNENIGDLRVSAQASNGGIDNLNLVQAKEAQVSFAVTSVIYESYKGINSFEGRPNEDLRILAGLYYNPNQVVVRGDSEVKSLKDLKGKRFASGAPGSTTEVETRVHLEEVGLKYPEDLKTQFVGFTEATDLMRNKQLDGAWIMAGLPTAAVTEITTTTDSRLVPMEEGLIEALQEKYPWYAKYKIPRGTYEGQEEDLLTSAIKMAIFTSADLDEDLAYEMTRSFWENLDQLQEANSSLRSITVEDAVEDLAGLPLHPGSLRYYRELGLVE